MIKFIRVGDDDTYSDSGVAASFEGLNVVG